jgi:translation initiation factor 2B subunit (eIF-2B alpha/beta/delta family)
VEKVLLQAQEDGKIFSVIVVDSKPLLEGTDRNYLIHSSSNLLLI